MKDSLSRTKLQELVVVRRADQNQSRTEGWSARMANLKVAFQTFNPNFIKEFIFWLREDAYKYNFLKFKDIIFINLK